MLDNIAIVPMNSELMLLSKNKIKSNLFYYMLGSMIGCSIAYYIGFKFYESVFFTINKIHKIITYKEWAIIHNSNITEKYIENLILFKSFIPLIPIAIINLISGYIRMNFVRFITLNFVMRIVRALCVITINRIFASNNPQSVEIISYILKAITASAIINLSLVIFYENFLYI